MVLKLLAQNGPEKVGYTLQTIRADISYSTYRANTIYGVLGIKVWIFNKEIL